MAKKPVCEELDRRFNQVGQEPVSHNRAKESLQPIEKGYRQMVEMSPDAIFLLDPHGRYLYANQSASTYFGKEPNEVIGKNLMEFFPGEHGKLMLESISRTFREKTIVQKERMIRVCGRDRYFSTKLAPLQNEAGQVVCVMGVAHDITELKQGEKALRENKEIAKTLLNALGDVAALVDEKGIILEINEAMARRFGRSESKLIGLYGWELLPPDVAEYRISCFNKVIRTGQPFRFEDQREGMWFDNIFYPVLDEQGKVTRVAILARDITERRRLEERLHESEEEHRRVVENANEAILVVQGERLKFINSKAVEMSGYSKEELTSKPYTEFIHPNDRDMMVENHLKRLRGEKLPSDYPFRLIDRGGNVRWAETNAVVMSWEGEPATLNFIRDITRRREAEGALRSVQRVLEASISAVALSDAYGFLTYVNPSFLRLWGYDNLREVLGRHATEFAQSPESIQEVIDALRAKGNWTGEFIGKKRDGSLFDVSISASFSQDEEGNPIVLMGSFVNITEQKRMREQLQHIERIKSIGTLAAGIAHDFNNILTAILTNISLAKLYGNLADDIIMMLSDAEKASLRARNLTQQLLAFAKGGEPVKRTTSLSGLLTDTAAFALSGSKSRCECSIPEDLWPVDIDEGQIGQAVQNLIINADQAMPRGGQIRISGENVTIKEELTPPLKSGRYVRVSITDQGTGIAKKHWPNIFDPFFTTKQKGSGLGLTTTFTIVSNHDGHIDVDSEVEVGTTFHIYLPASKRRARAEERKQEGPVKGEGKILLIDDEEIIRRSTGNMLKRLGYGVESVKDGRQAIKLYEEAMKQKQAFDVVIMDLTIPGGMGGKEAIKELKRVDPGAKVIVSSGYSEDTIMSRFKQYGFSGVAAKPYRVDELAEVIRRVILQKGR